MKSFVQGSWRRAPGYVAAHWRGEHTLARAFWINAIALGFMASIFLGFVAAGLLIGSSRLDQRLLWLPKGPLSWILLPFAFAIYIWATLGVFRSAKRALAQGARLKPLLAVMIVAGFSMWELTRPVLHFREDFVELKNFLKIMDRHVVLKILPDNTELLIMGNIGFGFADAVDRTLKDNPQVRTVKLASGGGVGFEAQRAA